MILMKAISTAGVALAIAGTIFVFRFGVPFRTEHSAFSFLMVEHVDQHEIDRTDQSKLWAWCGLAMMVSGAALQIAAIWL